MLVIGPVGIDRPIAICVQVAGDVHPRQTVVEKLDHVVVDEIEDVIMDGIFPDGRGRARDVQPVSVQITEPGALAAYGIQYLGGIEDGLNQVRSLPGFFGKDGNRGGGRSR